MAEPDRWIEVGSFASRGAAEAVVMLLSSEGIAARIQDIEGVGLGDYTGMGLMAVRVRERDRDRAEEVLGSASDADLEAEALAASPGTAEAAGGAPRRPATAHALRGRGWSVLLSLVVAAITAAVAAHSCGR